MFRPLAIAAKIAALAAIATAQVPAERLSALKWRLVGPFRGGRALAVTGVKGKPDTYYFGGVGGGVWRTDNSGRTWRPIFDNVSVASIGAIAVAPSDPSVIYVGSGEADMRSDIQQGDGMYKSIDAGQTWTHIGLTDTRQIGKILVDPNDANIVYVAALGHQYGPNPERGVFKSVDGGKNWDKVLFKNNDTGAIDLAMDPVDPSTIYASFWQTRRPPWNVYPPSDGPGGGVYKSNDAGKTWTQLVGHGFPDHVGRVGLAVSPVNRDRVYAMVGNEGAGGLFRSDDGGDTWTHVNKDPRTYGRTFYFEGITCDTKDADTIYAMNTSTYRSTDGGKTFTAIKGAPGGDDYHTMWVNPDDPNRMILSCDQGVVVSVDHGQTWSTWYNQPTGQFYHVVTDNRFPYWIYGSQQDSGAMAVPSRSIHSGISAMDERPINVGGESGTIAPDPLHPGVLIGNDGSKEDFNTAWDQGNDPTAYFPGENFRATWTLPVVASAYEPHVFYLSHQQIFRSEDDGITWRVISPDLSRKTTPVPTNLDGPTIADNNGTERHGVVYWISPSPISPRIWACTDDGLVWLSPDRGAHWNDVTPPQLTPWSKVGIVEASHANADTAYIAVDRHRLDDNHPYIYRTRDAGKHWQLIANGLPSDCWVNVVREDPRQPRLLYAGTDRAVYVSFDAGDHWQSIQLNLPAASMRDIVFGGDDVIVGTHGRAIWALDAAGVLRSMAAGSVGGTFLYPPDRACAFQRAGTFGFGAFDEGTPFPPEEPQGENPAWGAILDYYLDNHRDAVVFTVRDSHGRVIRRFGSADHVPQIDVNRLDIPAYWVHPTPPPSAEPGAHRFAWNMRYEDDGGPIVPPGNYTIEMSFGGIKRTQPLSVVRDPRLAATDDDLRTQFEFSLSIREEIFAANDALAKAKDLMKSKGEKLSQADHDHLSAIAGGAPAGRRRRRAAGPANGAGRLSRDAGSLAAIQGQVDSAPSAPNPAQIKFFRQLRSEISADIAFLKSISK